MPRKWQGMNFVRKDLRLAIYLRDGMACVWCAALADYAAKNPTRLVTATVYR